MHACRVRGFVKLSAVVATGTTVMMRSRMSAALSRPFSLCLDVVSALARYERPIACNAGLRPRKWTLVPLGVLGNRFLVHAPRSVQRNDLFYQTR